MPVNVTFGALLSELTLINKVIPTVYVSMILAINEPKVNKGH